MNTRPLHELQKQFQNFIHANELIRDGEKILLAVSGGLDSMVMCELFHQLGYTFSVAHCNFGLRGKESDRDENLVSQWTKKRDIECFIKEIEIEGSSIQIEAREKRYQWFSEICKERGFDRVATAHHLNDSLETTLLNLTRGTGVKGLAGIPLQNQNIIRPLLFASREEIQDYAKEQKIQWREDSSNAKSDYDRNKIRLEVIPKLKEINPSLERTFGHTKERFDLLAYMVLDQVEKILKVNFNEKEHELKLSWVRNKYDLLILSEILAEYGFNYVTVKEVYEAIGKPGKTFESSEWSLVIDRDSLFIKELGQQEFGDVIIGGEGVYGVGNRKLEVWYELAKNSNSGFKEHDGMSAKFDLSKLSFPIKVRKWRQGDTIQPLGMKGRKKISDLLIDLKVPLAKKNQVFVLESEGEIAWVIGYRISEKFKVEENSQSIVRMIESTKPNDRDIAF